MKDYRLSEIKNGYWGDSDITKSRGEYELLCELQYDLEDENIEPRDMLELPCKMPYNAGDTCEVRYVVLYMKDNGDVSITNGYTEAQADTVLEQLRGDKK